MRQLLTIRRTCLIGLVLVIIALVIPQSRWRLQVIAWKTAGHISYASWFDVVRRLTPSASDNWRSKVKEIMELKREEGRCGVLWRTEIGDFWARATDRAGLAFTIHEQNHQGIYEHNIARIRPGDVVIDAGAHLGIFTRNALLAGAELVVAVEPDPVNFQCLAKTYSTEVNRGTVMLVEAATVRPSG